VYNGASALATTAGVTAGLACGTDENGETGVAVTVRAGGGRGDIVVGALERWGDRVGGGCGVADRNCGMLLGVLAGVLAGVLLQLLLLLLLLLLNGGDGGLRWGAFSKTVLVGRGVGEAGAEVLALGAAVGADA
jgi:hypothetical protein